MLVHTKAVVTDFTSDAPVIISGSHNLSVGASQSNDENFLIIRGDTDLADRYGLELLRFYEHYRFRYFARQLALKQVQPLAADDSWSNDYYLAGDLRMLAPALLRALKQGAQLGEKLAQVAHRRVTA